ncbi:right-handed parallel beta-helix repeat-containing protein, partial [Actinomadura sp. RB99]|uniref:right-handed parallel beta-helix repeat-containing protein n=1 Tax=Actinomadura sp. RB99 TaxID=2691577 RepID=UPI00168A3502
IRVRGLHVSGGTQYAVVAYCWQDCEIDDITVVGQGGGVWVHSLNSTNAGDRTPVDGSTPTITGSQQMNGVQVHDVRMTGGGSYGGALQVEGEDTGFVAQLVASRISARDVAGVGVRLERVQDYRLTDVVVIGSGSTAISTFGTRRGKILGCHVNGATANGITADSRATAAAAQTDITIARCSVTGAANGIMTWAGQDLVIEDNDLDTITTVGIQASNSANRVTVRGNRLRSVGQPTNLTSTVTGLVCEANSFNAGGPGTLATAANATAETVVATLPIPANDAAPGIRYSFAVAGQASTTGTPTLTIRVRLGGVSGAVVAAFTGVVTSAGIAGRGWRISGDLHALTIGAAGTWAGGAL